MDEVPSSQDPTDPKLVNAIAAKALVDLTWSQKGRVDAAIATQTVTSALVNAFKEGQPPTWSSQVIAKSVQIAVATWEMSHSGFALSNANLKTYLATKGIAPGDGNRVAAIVAAAKARAATIPEYHPEIMDDETQEEDRPAEEGEDPTEQKGGRPQSQMLSLALTASAMRVLTDQHQQEKSTLQHQHAERLQEVKAHHRSTLRWVVIGGLVTTVAAAAIAALATLVVLGGHPTPVLPPAPATVKPVDPASLNTGGKTGGQEGGDIPLTDHARDPLQPVTIGVTTP